MSVAGVFGDRTCTPGRQVILVGRGAVGQTAPIHDMPVKVREIPDQQEGESFINVDTCRNRELANGVVERIKENRPPLKRWSSIS